MFLRFSALLFLASGAGFALGCSSTLETFACSRDSECGREAGRDGQCEAARVCSFSDPSCGENGRRYGDASGHLSNVCVGEEDDDPADGSVVGPEADADTNRPDAGGTQPPIDADTTPLIDAMDPNCVNLNMTVYDDYHGDDEVRVEVNGNIEFVCDPPEVPLGMDSMAACQYCMPNGANIRLKANSGASFELLITDCAMNCETDKECEFTAQTTCNSVHYFDVDHTPLPPLP